MWKKYKMEVSPDYTFYETTGEQLVFIFLFLFIKVF
jgi:hypothetical protein